MNEIEELKAYREANETPIVELAREVRVSPVTLRVLLNSNNPRPWDRTVSRIRRFLDAQKATRKSRKTRSH